MPGQNEPRQFGSGQMNFEFHPHHPQERLSQHPFERESRRSPSPSLAAPPGYMNRFLPPIHTVSQYRPEPSNRPVSYRPDRHILDELPSPERYPPYSSSVEENHWARQSRRSPTWQDRRATQPLNGNIWGRPPPSPPRRDTLAQPLFEPSENWKQSHGVASEHHERRWSYDNRVPGPTVRERSPERGPPLREHYSPPGYAPYNRYRNTSQVPDVREPYPYGSRSDSYRGQYSNSPPWSPAPYPPPDGYGTSPEPYYHEPPRLSHWEPRFSPPRPDQSKNFLFRRERATSAGSMHDEPGPATYRKRGISQDYTRQELPGPVLVPRWEPALRSPVPPAKLVPSSHASTKHVLLRPRSPPGSSKGNSHSPSQTMPLQSNKKVVEFAPGHSGRSVEPGVSAKREANSFPSRDDSQVIPSSERASPRHSVSSAIQASQLENSVSYDWPDSRSASSILHPGGDELSANDTDEGVVSRLLEPETQAVADNDPASPQNKLAEAETAAQPGDNNPMPHTQESPEPDIPLALQSAASRDAASASSALATSVAEQHVEHPTTVPQENVPDLPPMPMYEALRVIVMVRLQQQVQTQEERVNPVLMANLSKVEPILPSVASPATLVREVNSGERLRARQKAFASTKSSLEIRFAQRHMDLNEKVQQLREEYTALNEQWVAHCSKLDEVAKNLALQEAAATAGRTTRRSTTTMGDAVRSDLEMEQIIASLGNEELTDANHLGARNAAVIPDMISVVVGSVEYAFDDTNHEVENPAEYYAPHTGIHDWTEEEVSIFVEKFAQFPKQFGIIADSLPHKTTAQCVTFYYLHKHKHIDFRKVVASRVVKRKRGGRKQKSNALLTDIRQKDDESGGRSRRRRAELLPVPEPRRPRRAALQNEQTPTATPTPEPESEPRRRRARNATRVTGGGDEEENNDEDEATPKPAKRGRRTRKPRQPSSTPLSTPTIMEDIPPFAHSVFNERGDLLPIPDVQRDGTIWTKADRLNLLQQYGEDYERIAAAMPSKDAHQIFQFCQTYSGELRSGRPLPDGVVVLPTVNAKQAWGTSESSFVDPSLRYQPYRDGPSGSAPSFAPPSTHQLSIEDNLTQYSVARSHEPTLSHDKFHFSTLPHLTQYAASDNMSHLSIPMISRTEDRITNPSPFAVSSTFPDFPYNGFSASHYHASPASGGEGDPTDGRDPQNAKPTSASMAFDASPAFVPPPQTWTQAPLGTTDDLVAYLEHRTRLTQKH